MGGNAVRNDHIIPLLTDHRINWYADLQQPMIDCNCQGVGVQSQVINVTLVVMVNAGAVSTIIERTEQ